MRVVGSLQGGEEVLVEAEKALADREAVEVLALEGLLPVGARERVQRLPPGPLPVMLPSARDAAHGRGRRE
jgi:hypothetical protein